MNTTFPKRSTPFILVIEGIDFSGKTTLAGHVQDILTNTGYRVKLLHDPKGSTNSKVIWETILKVKSQDADPTTELFLFLAARNELIRTELLKDEVDIIIFDRFIFSTIAYQLTHKPASWEPFLATHRHFLGIMPDLCIYCDIDFDAFQHRSQQRDKKDYFDKMTKSHFETVKLAYQQSLELQLCPVIQLKSSKADFVKIMDHIMLHIRTGSGLHT